MTALDLQDHPHVDVQEPSTETAPASAPLSEEEAFLQAVRDAYATFNEVYVGRDDLGLYDIYLVVDDDTDSDAYLRAAHASIQLYARIPEARPLDHILSRPLDHAQRTFFSDIRRIR